MASAFHFADRFIARARALGHPLCVGLDPDVARIPALFRDDHDAETVENFLLAMLDRLAGKVAVVKPQIAFFEALGPAGIDVLAATVAAAHARGLLVLLDAKRGDIGSTAEAYARAYLEPESPIPVDAMTLSPYLGIDSLAPFVERSERFGRGLFVLAKTSNPGSADFQDRDVEGEPLFTVVSRSLAPLAERLRGPATAWSNLGVVVGATHPDHAPRVRSILPNSLFLVPGYGTQGGSATDALCGFVAGPSGREGGIVNSARALLYPRGADVARDAKSWETAIDQAVADAMRELSTAQG